MSNDPRVLVEFSSTEAAWLMDRLYDEWRRRVAQTALSTGLDHHVLTYHKHRASRLQLRIEACADNQGFGNL